MAELCLSTTKNINPKHKRYFMLRALLLQEKSMFNEALAEYNKAIELYPNDDAVLVDMSILYLRMGLKDIGYKLYNHVNTAKRINLYNLIDKSVITHKKNHIEKIQSLDYLSKSHISSKKTYNIIVF